MRFEIAKTVPDPDAVKQVCRDTAKAARMSTAGLFVQVRMYRRGSKLGACYDAATTIYRKGKPIQVKGYIKLFYLSINQIAISFAHELSHLKDGRLYLKGGEKIPWGKERRAWAFAQKIMDRMNIGEEGKEIEK